MTTEEYEFLLIDKENPKEMPNEFQIDLKTIAYEQWIRDNLPDLNKTRSLIRANLF